MSLYRNKEHRGLIYHPGESANPRLWNGNVLNVAPCIMPVGTKCPDLSPFRFDFAQSGTASAFSISESPLGPAMKFNGNVRLAQLASTGPIPAQCASGVNGRVTIQAYFRYNDTTNLHNIVWSDHGTVGGTKNGYQLVVSGSVNQLQLVVHDATIADLGQVIYWIPVVANQWQHVIVLWDADGFSDVDYGSTSRFFLDDVMTNPTVIGIERTITHLSTQDSRIGSCLSMTAPNFELALLNVWNRKLGWREMEQMYADPLAMYRRRITAQGRSILVAGQPWYDLEDLMVGPPSVASY